MLHSSRKITGGWERTDPDYIEYKENVLSTKLRSLGTMEDTLTKELIENINEKFGTDFKSTDRMFNHIDDIIRFIREQTVERPELFIDDFNYERIKFTIIPRGTRFYRRQTVNSFNNRSRSPVWLDYTGTMSNTPFSFLKDTNEIYTQQYLDNVKQRFGKYLLELETVKDLLIINFPDYVSSFMEAWIRRICIEQESTTCVDGYTMDVLRFNPNDVFKNLPSLSGFRELCINDANNLRYVKSIDIHDISSPHPLSFPIPPPSLEPIIIRKLSSRSSKGSSTGKSRRSSSTKSRKSSSASSNKSNSDRSILSNKKRSSSSASSKKSNSDRSISSISSKKSRAKPKSPKTKVTKNRLLTPRRSRDKSK